MLPLHWPINGAAYYHRMLCRLNSHFSTQRRVNLFKQSTVIPAQGGIQIRLFDQDVKELFDKRTGFRAKTEMSAKPGLGPQADVRRPSRKKLTQKLQSGAQAQAQELY